MHQATSIPEQRRLPRVCILTETYHPVVGGGEKQAQMLALDLAKEGFVVSVMTRRSSLELAAFEMIDGVPVYRIAPAGASRWPRWRMVVTSLRSLAKMRHDYDIIFVSGFKALGLSAVAIARLFGKVCILKADSNGEMSGAFFAAGLKVVRMSPSSPVVRVLLAARNAILRRADYFVAITSGIAEEFRQEHIDLTAIYILPNGVDTRRFRPLPLAERTALRARLGMPNKKTIITYTGRLVTYKGLPLLVRVAERLHLGHDVGFVLVGSGGLDIHNCEADIRRFVSDHGLESVIHFAGEVSNVHEYLKASDIFVLPTEDDAFPLALVEAMACGLPVVSTNVGGIPTIVSHGESGLLVKAGDFDELYDALRGLLADSLRSLVLGQAAARTVRSLYSREIVANRYNELFRHAYVAAGLHTRVED